MPLSCGHGTKRKVAIPEPGPDVDTEEKGGGGVGGGAAGENDTGTDPNGYEEVASSYQGQEGMCGYQCCPEGVHPDLQTCDKGKEAEERGKALELCLPPPHPCCTQQEASHLESHLYYKHRDIYEMVEALND